MLCYQAESLMFKPRLFCSDAVLKLKVFALKQDVDLKWFLCCGPGHLTPAPLDLVTSESVFKRILTFHCLLCLLLSDHDTFFSCPWSGHPAVEEMSNMTRSRCFCPSSSHSCNLHWWRSKSTFITIKPFKNLDYQLIYPEKKPRKVTITLERGHAQNIQNSP